MIDSTTTRSTPYIDSNATPSIKTNTTKNIPIGLNNNTATKKNSTVKRAAIKQEQKPEPEQEVVVDADDDWETAVSSISLTDKIVQYESSLSPNILNTSQLIASQTGIVYKKEATVNAIKQQEFYQFYRPDWCECYEPDNPMDNTDLLFHPLRSLVRQYQLVMGLIMNDTNPFKSDLSMKEASVSSLSSSSSACQDTISSSSSSTLSVLTCKEFNDRLKPLITRSYGPAQTEAAVEDVVTNNGSSINTDSHNNNNSHKCIIIKKAYDCNTRIQQLNQFNYKSLYDHVKKYNSLPTSQGDYYYIDYNSKEDTKKVYITFKIIDREEYNRNKYLCWSNYIWKNKQNENRQNVDILFHLNSRWSFINDLYHNNNNNKITDTDNLSLLMRGDDSKGVFTKIINSVSKLWSSHNQLNNYFSKYGYDIDKNATMMCLSLNILYQLQFHLQKSPTAMKSELFDYYKHLIDGCLLSPLFNIYALNIYQTYQPISGTAPMVIGYNILNTTSRDSESKYIIEKYIHEPIERLLIKIKKSLSSKKYIGHMFHMRCIELLNITMDYLTDFIKVEERYKYIGWLDCYGISSIIRTSDIIPSLVMDDISTSTTNNTYKTWDKILSILPFESDQQKLQYMIDVINIREHFWIFLSSNTQN